MPQAVGMAVATALGSALGAAATTTILTTAFYAGYALTYAAGAYLLNEAASALAPKPPKPRMEYGANFAGTQVPRRIIYGTLRVGGMETIPPIATDTDGKKLHKVLTLAGHEVYGFGSVFFEDVEILQSSISANTQSAQTDGVVTTGKFADIAWIRCYRGTSTQTVDYILNQADPTVFTSDFRGRGVAYLAVQMHWKGDSGGPYKGGVPNITAVVYGKQCYDPRTLALSSTQTSNPALCIRDYLVNEVGFESWQVDDSLCSAAANICDQAVTVPGGTRPRYTCNIALEAGADWESNLQRLVDCMRGRIVFRDGIWRMYAGAWDAATVTINTSDWIGPVRVQASAPREERWNAVRVQYVDKDRGYTAQECFPRRNTAYETADGGDRIWRELDLPGCDNEYEAQRHGEFALRASRNQLKVVGRLRPEFIKLSTWETVNVNDSDYGWASKTFRVFSMEPTATGEVDVVLVEEGSSTWTDLLSAEYDTITTAATIDPGASLPSVRSNFVATPLAGAIEFSWQANSGVMLGEKTRILEYANSGYAHLATEIWRGDATRVNIGKSDVVTRYYWVQGVIDSYTGPYTPNTFGYPMAANSAGAGAAGVDGINAALSLPAVTVPSSSNGTVADYSAATGRFLINHGAADVSTYAAFGVGSMAGCTATINTADNSPVAGLQKGQYRVTAVTSDVGVFWMTASYLAQNFLRQFVVTKATAGLPALILDLYSTGQSFRFSGSGTNIGVNTIGFDAVLQNISGTAGFYANNYRADGTMISSYALSGAGNTNRGLHVNSFTQAGTTAYCTVVASVTGGYNDRVTIVRLQDGTQGGAGNDGAAAVTPYLTNENHTLPSSSNGYVPSYSGASGAFVLMEGVSSVSVSSITFSTPSNPQALTHVFSTNGTYAVTGGFDAGETIATLTLRAAYKATNYDKVFTLNKSGYGFRGDAGPPSANLIANGDMRSVNVNSNALVGWTMDTAGGRMAVVPYSTTSGPAGGPAMFINTPSAVNVYNDALIPIDPFTDEIELAFSMRSSSNSRAVYVSLACLDAYGRDISYEMSTHWSAFNVTSGWVSGSTAVCVQKPNSYDWAFPGYSAYPRLLYRPAGFAAASEYDEPIDAIAIASVNTTLSTSFDVLNLSTALPTSVSTDLQALGVAGSTYKYPSNDATYANTATWQEFSWWWFGPETPYARRREYRQEVNALRHGTRYIKLYFLAQPGSGDIYVANVTIIKRNVARNPYVADPGMHYGGGWTFGVGANQQTGMLTNSPVCHFQPTSGPSGDGMLVFNVWSHNAVSVYYGAIAVPTGFL